MLNELFSELNIRGANIVKVMNIRCLHVPSSRTGFEFYKKIGFTKDNIQDDGLDEIT